MLGVAIATKTNAILAQAIISTLNTLGRKELFEIIDSGEKILQKSMPDGARDENIRYFAIIPNRRDAKPADIKVYSAYMQPVFDKSGKRTKRQVMIYDSNKKQVFPDAESVK